MTTQYSDQAYFQVTVDGDVIGTKTPIPQSSYFITINSETVLTIDGDKYYFDGEGAKAIKIT